MSAWTEFRDGRRAWWDGLPIITKTRISTGALCFAVGFLAGAVLL